MASAKGLRRQMAFDTCEKRRERHDLAGFHVRCQVSAMVLGEKR